MPFIRENCNYFDIFMWRNSIERRNLCSMKNKSVLSYLAAQCFRCYHDVLQFHWSNHATLLTEQVSSTVYFANSCLLLDLLSNTGCSIWKLLSKWLLHTLHIFLTVCLYGQNQVFRGYLNGSPTIKYTTTFTLVNLQQKHPVEHQDMY